MSPDVSPPFTFFALLLESVRSGSLADFFGADFLGFLFVMVALPPGPPNMQSPDAVSTPLAMLDEAPIPQLRVRSLELGRRVHHDRPGPGYRLLQRPAAHQQKADALLSRAHRDLIAGIKHDQRPITGLVSH